MLGGRTSGEDYVTVLSCSVPIPVVTHLGRVVECFDVEVDSMLIPRSVRELVSVFYPLIFFWSWIMYGHSSAGGFIHILHRRHEYHSLNFAK